MKKIILSSIAFLSLVTINAQITLTNSFNAPTVGDTYSVLTYDSTATLQLTTGANQTWDFSNNTTASTGGYTIGYYNPSSDILSPTGTTVIEVKNNQKLYLKNSTNQLEILAYTDGVNSFSVFENQSITYRDWPFNYGDRYNDTGNGSYSTSDPNFPSSGSISPTAQGTVAGYGTLIAPNGTSYSNIIMVVDTLNYVITYNPQTNVVASGGSQQISYKFYSSTYKYPVLNVIYSISTQSAINTFNSTILSWQQAKSYEIEYTSSISLNSIETLNKTDVNVFPNPLNDLLNISLIEDSEVQIYDINGTLINQNNMLAGLNQIDLSQNSKGVYFLKSVTKSGKSSFLKLIKE